MSDLSDQSAMKLQHLPIRFVKSAAIAIPLQALLMATFLTGITAIILHGQADGRWWASVTRWSLTTTSLLLGLVGGGLLGLISSAKKTVQLVENQLRMWFQQLPPMPREADQAPRSLQEIRQQYESTMGKAADSTIGRIPIPGFLDRLIRSALRKTVVDDFINSLEEQGVSHANSQEFRNWVLTKGLALGLQPAYDQFAFWRYVIITLLVVFLVGSAGIAFLSR
ncbi:hypothetical protein [Petrachloros mirabilis]